MPQKLTPSHFAAADDAVKEVLYRHLGSFSADAALAVKLRDILRDRKKLHDLRVDINHACQKLRELMEAELV